jgi:hypothetical protein
MAETEQGHTVFEPTMHLRFKAGRLQQMWNRKVYQSGAWTVTTEWEDVETESDDE